MLRAANGRGCAFPKKTVFVADRRPVRIAFYPVTGEPQWLYVAENNRVERFPSAAATCTRAVRRKSWCLISSNTTGGHTTRDLVFSRDGRRMFISVGSDFECPEGMPEKSPAEIREWEGTRLHGAAWGSEGRSALISWWPIPTAKG